MAKAINEREIVAAILMEVTENGRYSHIVLREVLTKYQYLEKRERAFITRVTEGTLEHMTEIDYILDCFSKVKVKKMKPLIRAILRSAVYQIKYMDSIPDHAVCSESVKLAVKKGFSGLRGYVNGVLRSVVKGIDDVAVRFAKCCSPVPGDEIVGFVTRGRGVTIHRTDCVNMIHLPSEDRVRLIDAEWQAAGDMAGRYPAEIKIFGNNRTGLLVDISKIFTERQIDMIGVNSRTSKQGTATISLSFEVGSRGELDSLIAKLRQVESVIDIERTTG